MIENINGRDAGVTAEMCAFEGTPHSWGGEYAVIVTSYRTGESGSYTLKAFEPTRVAPAPERRPTARRTHSRSSRRGTARPRARS